MELATCTIEQSICTIILDDGKANAMSTRMIEQISALLDRAEAAQATVIITGRAGMFSAGFDLGVFKAGGDGVVEMLSAGAALTERMLSFPYPIVVACSGHAMAMGLFVVLCADYAIGVADDTRVLRLNEVAIGLTMPLFAVEVAKQRLTPPAFNRAVIIADSFNAEKAVAAGCLDEVVPAAELLARAQQKARELASLNMVAHAATKLRARAPTLAALRAVKEADLADWKRGVGPR